jgi:hypothetical protein
VDAADPVAEYVSTAESTEQHLLDWLIQHRNASYIRLLLAGLLDLSSRDGRQALCLLLQAREKVTIRPRDKEARPTIRLAYQGEPAQKALIALTIDSPASEIEGIRFIIDSARTSFRPMAALHLRGGKHSIRRCEFIQARPDLKAITKDNRLASLVADTKPGQRAEVALQECVFVGFEGPRPGSGDRPVMEDTLVGPETGGQDAIVRRGAVALTVTSCVFGPHAAALRLEGNVGEEQGKVELKHCSVLLPAGNSAVFDVQPETTAHLTVSHCLFSRLGRESSEDQGAVLIRQAEDTPNSVGYQGNDNCYHDLDGYWAVGDDWKKAGWSDFKRRTRDPNPSRDTLSRVVLTQPWQAGVDEQLAALKQLEDVAGAFRPNLNLAVVRETGASTTRLVGAETVLGKPLATSLPELEEKAGPARRVLVVEQDKDADDSPNGIYPSLDTAVGRARPGDTILVRHDGTLQCDPVQLTKKNLGDLTIRPARWFRPVIVPGDISEPETALFRLQDGKLILERLEFRLRTKTAGKTLTVLALAGNGVCELRDCLVTLERSGDTTVALASLSTTGAGMRLDMPELRKPDEGPRLLLERCFVRGDGDLLVSRASRPCELELKDSLAALSGTFLHLDVSGDGGTPKSDQKVNVLLTRSTTYLGGHLVRLAGKDRRSLVPIKVTATKCLFVPAGSRALIQLDMPNTEEKSVKDKFSWEGSENAYGAYTMLLAQNPGGEEMAPLPIRVDKWKQEYPGEDDSKFGVELAGTISSDTRFTDLEPGPFRPSREARESGVKARLPEPRAR